MSSHATEQATQHEAQRPQQVMSAQVAKGAEAAALEGETRGPDYGAVTDGGVDARGFLPNGVTPYYLGAERTGVSSAGC